MPNYQFESLIGHPAFATKESGTRWFVPLVSSIYWLLIFEGVLRKWIFPEWGRVLFFVRDPLVILVYVLAFKHRMKPKQSPFLVVGILFATISLPLLSVQFLFRTDDFDWIIAAYGWRNYFFYFPLAFIVAKQFPPASLNRIIRWTLLLTVPIAVLVYLQFNSPASAPINSGLGKLIEFQYGNGGTAGGFVRTYGTFTSAVGQQAFIVAGAAMLLATWMAPRERRPLSGGLLVLSTVAVLTCAALSGSRGTVIWCGLVVMAALGAALVMMRRTSFRILLLPVTVIVTATIFVPVAFPEAVTAFSKRWSQARQLEVESYGEGGIFTRAIYDLFSFRLLLAETPLDGYQLGVGGNAAVSMHSGKNRTHFSASQSGAAESDWGRHILELGPLLGVFFIGFRISFTVWLATKAIRATKRSRGPLPLLLFVFEGILLFNGEMTGHGTLNGYCWLFAGFLIAICDAQQNMPAAHKYFVLRREQIDRPAGRPFSSAAAL